MFRLRLILAQATRFAHAAFALNRLRPNSGRTAIVDAERRRTTTSAPKSYLLSRSKTGALDADVPLGRSDAPRRIQGFPVIRFWRMHDIGISSLGMTISSKSSPRWNPHATAVADRLRTRISSWTQFGSQSEQVPEKMLIRWYLPWIRMGA